MPSCYKRYDEGYNFGCGPSWYENRTTVDLTTFSHDPSNASRALLGFNGWYQQRWGNVIWINPNLDMGYAIAYYSSTEYHGIKIDKTIRRWTGCPSNGSYVDRETSGSFTGTISNTDSSIKCFGVTRNKTTDPWPGFSNQESCWIEISLPNTHKILPPKDLQGDIGTFNINEVNVSATVSSWSDNPNIKGIPYTLGGGANWNWGFKIMQGTTLIKEVYLAGDNSLSKNYKFTNLNLISNTAYTIHYFARNDFQQEITATRNFTIPEAPSEITVSNIVEKPSEVNAKASLERFGTNTAKWDFYIKEMNGTLIKTNSITFGTNKTPSFSFNGLNLKLGKEYRLEAKCTNTANLSTIGNATFRLYLGWIVPPTGTPKKIIQAKVIDSTSVKDIVKIKTT